MVWNRVGRCDDGRCSVLQQLDAETLLFSSLQVTSLAHETGTQKDEWRTVAREAGQVVRLHDLVRVYEERLCELPGSAVPSTATDPSVSPAAAKIFKRLR